MVEMRRNAVILFLVEGKDSILIICMCGLNAVCNNFNYLIKEQAQNEGESPPIKNFLLIGGDTISSLQDTHMV